MSNNNQNIREQIYLAALLHDIGKLAFRAQGYKKGEDHELLGEQFIRENFGRIEILKSQIEEIINQSKHHYYNTLTANADRIASMEREEDEEKNARRPLFSIFNSISLQDELLQKNETWYYDTKEFNVKSVFPIKTNNEKFDEKKLIENHRILLNNFIEEIKKIQKIKNLYSLNTTIYYLLYKYTTRVLSAGYYSTPDISLFDHSKAVAGLVNCLTHTINDINNLSNIKKDFLYLKGDLKGIQKFIYYNVEMDQAGSTKGLSKRLRGRSFLISLLTDVLANIFIEKLNLSDANLLYSGGGHFNIIAPYNDTVINNINQLVEELNICIHEKLGRRIHLVVAYTQCDDTLYLNTGKFIQEINFKLNQQKYKLHKNYLEKVIFNKQQNQLNEKIEENIGQKLPYTKYIIEINSKESHFSKLEECLFYIKKFNKYYLFINNKNSYDKIYSIFNENKEFIESVKLIKINDSDFLEYAEKLCESFNFPISFTFKYFGLFAPKNEENSVIEFEEIATINYREKNENLSYPLLGVMRLDVDNLGSIFEYGLGDKASFSRIASLSRELDLFFCGYFNILAEKYKVYIVYSGGDDAFIVGSWYNILHFAKELYEKFKEFVCYNKEITFSAGIFFCHENYPIAKFAEKAAELEELSKNFKDENGNEKNAVTIFDHTLSWNSYCNMLEFAEKLLSYTNQDGIKDKNKLNRSLVHRLLRIIKSSLNKNGSVNTEKLYKNVAQLHYLLARHGFDANKIDQAQDGIIKDVIVLILKEFSKEKIVKNYLIPTNYVILKTRKIK